MADRHVLQGDLDWLEYAIADYIAKWGEHLTGRPYDGNIAGIPCATANMAMSVIRKNIVGSWTEPRAVSEPPVYQSAPLALCENCGKSMTDHGMLAECWPLRDGAS